MRAFQTLRRYRRLLARYLVAEWPRVGALAATLGGAIAVQIVTPLAISRFIDRAIAGAALRDLIGLALLTMGLALAGQALAVAETYLAERVSWSATNSLRVDLLAHLLRLDASFHTARTPGELIERVDGDVSTLAHFFSRFVVNIAGNALLILGVLALLFSLDWRVGLGLAVFVAIAFLTMVRIRAAATPFWAEQRQATAGFYGFLGDYLSGLEDVRSSGARGFVLRRCAETMRSWRAATIKAGLRGYALVASGEGLFALGMIIALAICAARFRDGALTIGSVYLIFQYAEMLRSPAERIRDEVQDLQEADAGLGRVEALFAVEPRIVDGPAEALPFGPLSLELDHVSFGYEPAVPVLRDVTARVAPGRVLGVIGRTGSGKTTLTRLIPRFYDPLSGSVRLGGVDLRALHVAAVRSRIGLVSQDVHLFNASVRDNLTLFNDRLSDDRIAGALDALGLTEWASRLPDGLDTTIGDGGLGLSGGEAQLLACARVFLGDPDLVILDEASSRLDPATERLVETALARLLQGRTGVVVAHRLATIALADDILVLEDGGVREFGPRLALVADPSSRFGGLLRLAAEEVAR